MGEKRFYIMPIIQPNGEMNELINTGKSQPYYNASRYVALF